MNKFEKRMNWILNRRRRLGTLERIKGKTEEHHIIPRSLGGDDSTENLIMLTTREHFLVHYCLWKMYPKDSASSGKMVKAFTMMVAAPADGHTRYLNSRLYAAAQVEKSKAMSIAQSGERNSQFGSMWIFTFDPEDPNNMEKRKEKKLPKGSEIPSGWLAGRKMSKFKICKNPACKASFRSQARKKVYCCDECKIVCAPLNAVKKVEKEFIEAFKKCGIMDKALKEVGIHLGSVGSHAQNARKILEEHNLTHLLKTNHKI